MTVRDLELHPVAFARAASNAPEPVRDTVVDPLRPPALTQQVGDAEIEPLALVRASRSSTRPNARAAHALEAQKRGHADPLIGQVVADRYRIVSLLGRGGMGVVYKVEHIYIGKLMAMKLLSGEFARDALTVRRFHREAKAISKLLHSNTVQIFDFGQSAGLVYLVMEYLPGRDLGTVLADDGPLAFERTARIVAQVAASVGEAHRKGIIHRDLKPENVMVLDSSVDLVKVLDFGIAQLRDDADEHSFDTASGTIVGTPYYMAPEQIRGGRVDARVDIYALGGLMYKATVGIPPFVADTPMAVLAMHLSDPLVPMGERAGRDDIPAEAEAIVARCLAKDRDARYASMDELRQALLDYLKKRGADEGAARQAAQLRLSTESLRPGEVLATRGDVDQYEARIHRSHFLARVAGVALIAAASYGTYELVELARPREQSVETEPNNDASHANVLLPDRPLNGYLGKRTSYVYSDADVYRIDLGFKEERVADIALSAIPNMDVVLELVKGGHKQPLLMVDGGGRGEPERIANFTLKGGTYYVRVRERWVPKVAPTENVSDQYAIALRFRAHDAMDETEPNDGFETAELIHVGTARQGLLGWAGDRDVYCLGSAPRLPLRVVASGALLADLSLAGIEPVTDTVLRANGAPPGEAEQLDVPLGRLTAPCFEVRASDASEAARADADRPYTIVVSELPPAEPAAELAEAPPDVAPEPPPEPARQPVGRARRGAHRASRDR